MKDKILSELKQEFPDVDIEIGVDRKVQFHNSTDQRYYDRISVKVYGQEFAVVEEHPFNRPITIQTIFDKIRSIEHAL